MIYEKPLRSHVFLNGYEHKEILATLSRLKMLEEENLARWYEAKRLGDHSKHTRREFNRATRRLEVLDGDIADVSAHAALLYPPGAQQVVDNLITDFTKFYEWGTIEHARIGNAIQVAFEAGRAFKSEKVNSD